MRRLSMVEWLFLAVVVICAASVGTGAVLVSHQIDQNRRLARDGVVAKKALCTYRAGLVESVAQAKTYLHAHPEGFPGIPAATIRANIATQQTRVASLHILNCSTP